MSTILWERVPPDRLGYSEQGNSVTVRGGEGE
ncbi:F0F1 ATP synthase subunit epsilon, partial [Clostridium perfringens]